MAASDNVVRSGLTYSRIYDPPIQEFVVSKTELPQKGNLEELQSVQGPSICIITQGNGELRLDSQQEKAPCGSVFFIKSNTSFILENTGNEPVILYRAFCE